MEKNNVLKHTGLLFELKIGLKIQYFEEINDIDVNRLFYFSDFMP